MVGSMGRGLPLSSESLIPRYRLYGEPPMRVAFPLSAPGSGWAAGCSGLWGLEDLNALVLINNWARYREAD